MKRNIDLDWYENRAKSLLKSPKETDYGTFLENISSKHLRPFLSFYELISTNIQEGSKVLEIGSGTGDHTGIILNTKAEVTTLDISPSSLQVLRLRHPTIARTITANMENLPFGSEEFDAVISCASLSYGNFRLVSAEIYRVLKPGGYFIVLDTLANNPIFMLIRFRHVLLGRRSLKTLVNMPSLRCIRALEKQYQSGTTTFFAFFFPFLGNTRNPINSILVYPFKFLTYLNKRLENSSFRFLCHKFTFVGTKPHSKKSD